MDKIFYTTKKRVLHNRIRSVIAIIGILIISVVGFWGTYTMLLDNEREMGLELIKSYVADEERNTAVYIAMLKTGMMYLDDLDVHKIDYQYGRQIMDKFFKSASEITGDSNIKTNIIINNELLTDTPISGLDINNYMTSDWYEEAISSGGRVVTKTVKNQDKGKGYSVMNAMVNPLNGNAIVMEVGIGSFVLTHLDLTLPERAAYYLCDEDGHLLYYRTPFDVERGNIEEYMEGLCEKINTGRLSDVGDDIIDLKGEKRSLYYSKMSNGWTCILTIPRSTLMVGFQGILLIYAAICVIVIAVVIISGVREMMLGNSMIHTSAVLRALCNTYYAIYSVNVTKETYHMVKGTEKIQGIISKSGKYNDMVKGFISLMDEETVDEFVKSFSIEHLRQLVQEDVHNFGGDFLRKQGDESIWVNISVIIDKALNNDEVVIVFRQIDSEKTRQLSHIRILENAIAASDASERSQRQFFSKMSHEMRTPLNIILGMNKLAMKEDCTVQKRLDYQNKIEQSGREMLLFINNILEMSKIEDGLMPLDKKEINICEEFRNIVQPFGEQARSEGKEFVIKTDVINPIVTGDSLKITQILNNVVSNAVNFTDKGDTITVSLTQAGIDNDNYVFTIEDTGIGMSEAFVKKIYEPCTKEKRFADKSSGTGLGMAIVKSIVTQKGGQIEVSSKTGVGTKVVITLPFYKEHKHEHKEIAPQKNFINSIKGMNVLVVDDNVLNRELLCEMLEDEGANVMKASDGREAIDVFEKSDINYFDVIIMDMQMPLMDGCEAAKAIRQMKREDAGCVLIIALTANSFSEDVIKTVQAGMNAHLAKPADINKIKETITRLYLEMD